MIGVCPNPRVTHYQKKIHSQQKRINTRTSHSKQKKKIKIVFSNGEIHNEKKKHSNSWFVRRIRYAFCEMCAELVKSLTDWWVQNHSETCRSVFSRGNERLHGLCWRRMLDDNYLPLLPTPWAPNTAIFTSDNEDFFLRMPRVVILNKYCRLSVCLVNVKMSN